jgi:hypothetical protein
MRTMQREAHICKTIWENVSRISIYYIIVWEEQLMRAIAIARERVYNIINLFII